jgi:hypothetical protein
MRRLVFAAAFLAALAVPLGASAQQKNDNESWDGGFGQKDQRRADFVLGVSPGIVFMSANGYPNEVAKIGDPAYHAMSGFAAGPGFEAWIGGALTDWFTFGVGGAYLHAAGSDSSASGGAFLIRIETFPLYKLGLRDLAVFGNFGAGGLSLHGQDQRHAAGGFASVGGGGLAYEVVRLGHFAIAPTAEYLLIASQTLTSHQAIIGVRAVFYGGPS